MLEFLNDIYRSDLFCANCDERADLMYEGVCIDCRLDPGKN